MRVRVNLASRITAPEGSLTVPCTVAPPPLCARAAADTRRNRPVVLRKTTRSTFENNIISAAIVVCLLRMRSLHLSYWLAPALIGLILLLLSTVTGRSRLRKIYEFHFPETPRERLFLSFVGFFVTIGVVRMLTWCIHNGIGPFHDVQLRGRHIHHLVWGIILLLLVGYG